MDDLDEILNNTPDCAVCGDEGCFECEDDIEFCSICDGQNGDHYPNCPEDYSPFARLCREGYD